MHTSFSGDARSELPDILAQARKMGLTEIAITDHGPSHLAYGIKKKNLFVLKDMIDKIQPEFPDIKIKMGIEANVLMDGSLDISDDVLPILDWVNAGYHFGSRPFRDFRMHAQNLLSKLLPCLRKQACRTNTQAIIKAMENYRIDLLTHPGDKGPVEIVAIAETAYKRNVLLEINAWHKNLTVQQLRQIEHIPVKFAIGSDAHSPGRVGSVQPAIDRLKESGIDPKRVVNLEIK